MSVEAAQKASRTVLSSGPGPGARFFLYCLKSWRRSRETFCGGRREERAWAAPRTGRAQMRASFLFCGKVRRDRVTGKTASGTGDPRRSGGLMLRRKVKEKVVYVGMNMISTKKLKMNARLEYFS